eukprot:2290937-Heterocapsa_arctica.AAC.1
MEGVYADGNSRKKDDDLEFFMKTCVFYDEHDSEHDVVCNEITDHIMMTDRLDAAVCMIACEAADKVEEQAVAAH